MGAIHLREAERLEISILVDNYSDVLLSDTEIATRLRAQPPNAPLAEHGLSCLVSVSAGEEKHTILMDAGISGTCMRHNANLLETSRGAKSGTITHTLADVESVVLSHGHFDHFHGLPLFFKDAPRKTPMVLHPAAFLDRRHKVSPEESYPLPSLSAEVMEEAGAVLDRRPDPSTLAADLILVGGHVARITDFEKGVPALQAHINGEWIADPFEDDQGIAFNLKGKGLVVLGGCSHAGIINTVKHMCTVSGVGKVHAVLGGFHLTGSSAELIETTAAAMKEIAPDYIVPMHCTGWSAINTFEARLPEQFVLNSVGTTYIFKA